MRLLLVISVLLLAGCDSERRLSQQSKKAEREAQKVLNRTLRNPRAVQLVIERGLLAYPYKDSFELRPGKIVLTHNYQIDTIPGPKGETIIREKYYTVEKSVDTMAIWERAKLRFFQATMDSMEKRLSGVIADMKRAQDSTLQLLNESRAETKEVKKDLRYSRMINIIFAIIALSPLLVRFINGPGSMAFSFIRKLFSK